MNFDVPFIIAEAGTCHADNDPDIRLGKAIRYASAAASVGASAVKYQIFDDPNPETMFCWIDGDKERSIRWGESRVGLDGWKVIKAACDDFGIVFMASVFEYETVKWLSEIGVEVTKVASRAAGNLEAFRHAPKPLLVSNGMYHVEEAEGMMILECEANYPSTSRWSGKHGFSDHSGNPRRAIDAIYRGCNLVEVHFYIDPKNAGPDLPASLSLDELKLVCEARDAQV